MVTSIQASSLDDLLREVLSRLVAEGEVTHPKKGEALELRSVILELTNPLARLSRSHARGRLFSALGELAWYLSGSNDAAFIGYYMPKYAKLAEDGRLPGGYGPRLFEKPESGQLLRVIERLSTHQWSRQAVIQLFDQTDLAAPHEDVPCTCTLQFFVRGSRLELVVHMRSNDAVIGLPHDVFSFTMLQEIVARSLNLNLGTYTHFAGSMHMYSHDRPKVEEFLDEGWHATDIHMPEMPAGEPWSGITKLLAAESEIRTEPSVADSFMNDEGYWGDLIRLFAALAFSRAEAWEELEAARARMTVRTYDVYLHERQAGEVDFETRI